MTYLQLTKLADVYCDVWTSDGIDAFHADRNEVAAWLKRTDLRTESDAALDALTNDEIDRVADMIAEKVAENLPTPYYILRDLDGDGSEYPVCVDRDEAERLVREWECGDFDEIWREASENDIAKYGRYDTMEQDG